MTGRRSIARCQRRLLVVWYGGAAPLLALLVAQTVLGLYGERAGEAWTWLLPNLMPTLSLVTGVVVAQPRREADGGTASTFAYRLAAALSAAYLLLLAVVVVAAGFAASRLDAMREAEVFLGPVQGLVTSALGAFFVTRKDEEAAPAGAVAAAPAARG